MTLKVRKFQCLLFSCQMSVSCNHPRDRYLVQAAGYHGKCYNSPRRLQEALVVITTPCCNLQEGVVTATKVPCMLQKGLDVITIASCTLQEAMVMSKTR
jgi:hypothetical protein